MADITTTAQPCSHTSRSLLSTRNDTVTQHEKKRKKSARFSVSTDLSTSILLSHFRRKLDWLALLAKSFQTQLLIQCRPLTTLKNLRGYATVADTSANFRLLGKKIYLLQLQRKRAFQLARAFQAFQHVDICSILCRCRHPSKHAAQ
uniref:Uncharacterized protein n=1 Tax=Rhipicephalus zambeziensis TaxID=60191 RepID=A0A224YGC9_9ACAR